MGSGKLKLGAILIDETNAVFQDDVAKGQRMPKELIGKGACV